MNIKAKKINHYIGKEYLKINDLKFSLFYLYKMNINVYKKVIRQITSFPTVEIIEKTLNILKLTHFIHYQICFIGNTCGHTVK